jgi:hypothetical protein
MSEYNQSLSENLAEMQAFLNHIEGRVGEAAYAHICAVVEEAVKQNEELEKIISSDSVYTLLRYGVKSPSSSGVDECEVERHYDDLYSISIELRKVKKS